MMMIRLARSGAKKRPFYYIVATDKRSARDGRFVERLGYYNPVAAGAEQRLHVNLERIKYWEGCGAELSLRVKHLLQDEGQAAASAA